MNKSLKSAIWMSSIAIILVAIALFAVKTLNIGGNGYPSTSTSNGAASITLVSPVGGTVDVGHKQDVAWTSIGYNAPTVSVMVIRKVSDNPARYELVRTVAASTKDDGSAVWVPMKGDVGSNVQIEVGCALSSQACTAGISSGALAVIDTGKYSNAAATWKAIEQLDNK